MPDSKPLLSIITVCLNAKRDLRRTLRAVRRIPHPAVEHIVVDGGSVDGSVDLLGQSECIRYISEKDSGIFNALNKGIRMAEGRFVLVLNAGDLPHPNLNYAFIEYLRQAPERCIIGSVYVYAWLPCFSYVRVNTPIDHSRFNVFSNHQGALIPRSFHFKHGFYDEAYRLSSDTKLFNDWHAAGVPIESIDRAISFMSHGGLSTSQVDCVISELSHVLAPHVNEDRLVTFLIDFRKVVTHEMRVSRSRLSPLVHWLRGRREGRGWRRVLHKLETWLALRGQG